MADATLVAAIRKAAGQTGADPVLMLATVLTETGGAATWNTPPGDNNTSFGPFQFHIGGALGSNPPAWASTYAAIVNRAKAFVGATTGADAARIQGPADPVGYAAKVTSEIPTARQLLAQVPASTPTSPTASATSAATPTPGLAVSAIVETQIGVPYSWAGGTLAGPSLGSGRGAGTVGFDCSGLVLWAFGQLGIVLPHYTGSQYALGQPVAKADLQPGDVVFFEPDASGTPGHEGIYAGGGKVVAAPQTGEKVAAFNLSDRSDYVGARRYTSNAAVDRNGTLIKAAAGRGVAADSSALSTAWKAAVAKLLPTASSNPKVINAKSVFDVVTGSATPADYDAANPVGHVVGQAESAATGVASGVESWATATAPKAFVWVALVGGSLALIYLGFKRSTGIDPVAKGKESAMKLAPLAAA